MGNGLREQGGSQWTCWPLCVSVCVFVKINCNTYEVLGVCACDQARTRELKRFVRK